MPPCGLQALDKVRYMSLTDPDALGEGDSRELDIKVCPLAARSPARNRFRGSE
eukprot:SAG11_NODE_20311_length_448_cov_1.028653_2_plen_52_part_01